MKIIQIIVLLLCCFYIKAAQAGDIAPQITTQPQDQLVKLGNNATFSVVVTGTAPFVYQWQKFDLHTGSWVSANGDSYRSYMFAATLPYDSGMQVRCVITNSAGSAISNVATLTVKQPPLVYAGADQSIPLSTAATLNPSVRDDNVSLGSPMTYLWSKVLGPGDVIFSDPTDLHSTVIFSQAGKYILRLTASNGLSRGSDQTRITVGQPVSCTALDPGRTDAFYVDSAGVCGPCNDNSPGTITQPWCSIERAFDQKKTPHLSRGGKLYIRGGVYRFNTDKFVTEGNGYTIRQDIISGFPDPGNKTEISGYPGERPIIYLSKRVDNTTYVELQDKSQHWTGWQSYGTGSNIWWFPWKEFVREYFPLHMIFSRNPQLIAIDEQPPVLLQQINSAKNDYLRPTDIRSVGTDQHDMWAGSFYYESASASSDFGKLFVWLPDGSNPNNKPMEVSLGYFISLGSQHNIKVTNLTVRYGELGGLTIGGHDNLIEDVDSSYNPNFGIQGLCTDCTVSNSVFNHNGFGGVRLNGTRVIIENNLIEGSNWKGYNGGWDCGQKLWGLGLAFRGNMVRNSNHAPGLWFDYDVGGHVVENNIFENNAWGVMVEVTPKPNAGANWTIIRNNIFLNSDESWWLGGVYISSSQYVLVANNLFYNTAGGVVMHGVDLSIPDRSTLAHNRVYNNIFNKVTFPVTIVSFPSGTPAPGVVDNLSDYNLFYETGDQSLWDYFTLPSDATVRSIPCLCSNWCSGPYRYALAQWQTLGYDLHSQVVDPLLMNPTMLDFHLRSSSPAITSGLSLPEVTTDMDGNIRLAIPDIGPFQYVTGIFYGDVSGDGQVDAYDAALTAQDSVGLITFTSAQVQVGDVDGNGSITAYDAALIGQKSVGLITKFPVEN